MYDWTQALRQAITYQIGANRAWIAMPLLAESRSTSPALALTPFALRPVEARVTAQADEVLGSDLFNLLLPCIRPDPFELCFRSTLSACAHGHPSPCRSMGLVEEDLDGFGRLRFLAFISRWQSIARSRESHRGSYREGACASRSGGSADEGFDHAGRTDAAYGGYLGPARLLSSL